MSIVLTQESLHFFRKHTLALYPRRYALPFFRLSFSGAPEYPPKCLESCGTSILIMRTGFDQDRGICIDIVRDALQRLRRCGFIIIAP